MFLSLDPGDMSPQPTPPAARICHLLSRPFLMHPAAGWLGTPGVTHEPPYQSPPLIGTPRHALRSLCWARWDGSWPSHRRRHPRLLADTGGATFSARTFELMQPPRYRPGTLVQPVGHPADQHLPAADVYKSRACKVTLRGPCLDICR